MRHIALYLLSAAVLFVGCAKENPGVKSGAEKKKTVYMEFSAGVGSKTALESDMTVNWKAGDKITVFSGKGTGYEFTTDQTGSLVTFAGNAVESQVYYAMYPYSASQNCLIGDGNKLNLDFPSIAADSCILFNFPCDQKGYPGTFDPAANIAFGRSEGQYFSFKNLCALAAVDIESSDIKEIVFLGGRGSEKIAGVFRVSVGKDGVPLFKQGSVSPKSDAAVGVLEAQDGGRIFFTPSEGETFAPGRYYICVPPVNMTEGYRLRITRADGKIAEIEDKTPLNLQRSHWYELSKVNSASLEFKNAICLRLMKVSFQLPGRSISNLWPFTPTHGSFSSGWGTPKEGTVNTYFELTEKESGYKFHYWASTGASPHGAQGFRIGAEKGDFFEFPAVEGAKLIRVEAAMGTGSAKGASLEIRTAASQTGRQVDADGNLTGTRVTGGDSLQTDAKWKVLDWKLEGTEVNTPYRMVFNSDPIYKADGSIDGNNIGIAELILWYEEDSASQIVISGVKTAAPEIDEDDYTAKATIIMKGEVEYSGGSAFSTLQGGFEYRQGTEGEWTDVQSTVSNGIVSASVDDLRSTKFFEYRAYVIKDGSKLYGKTKRVLWLGYRAKDYDESNAKSLPTYSYEYSKLPHLSMTSGNPWIQKDSTDYGTGYKFIYYGQCWIWKNSGGSCFLGLMFNNMNSNANTNKTWEESGHTVTKGYAYFSIPGIEGYRLSDIKQVCHYNNSNYTWFDKLAKTVTVRDDGSLEVSDNVAEFGQPVNGTFSYIKKDNSTAEAKTISVWAHAQCDPGERYTLCVTVPTLICFNSFTAVWTKEE